MVPVNNGLVRPSLAASPSMWSRTSAPMPPCTRPGGPSYATPKVNSDQYRPSSSWWISMGGAIALRSPTAGLVHASGRPVSAWRRIEVSECVRSSVSVVASMAAMASRMVSSSTPVRMPAAISLRMDCVSGSYTSRSRLYSSAPMKSNGMSLFKLHTSCSKDLSYDCFRPTGHPQVVVEELAAVVVVPACGQRHRVELTARARQLIGWLAANQDQRVARPRRGQPRLPQQIDVPLGNQLGRPDGVERLQRRRAAQRLHPVRVAQLHGLHGPLDVGQPAAAELG